MYTLYLYDLLTEIAIHYCCGIFVSRFSEDMKARKKKSDRNEDLMLMVVWRSVYKNIAG